MKFFSWTNFAKRLATVITIVNLGGCAAVVSGSDSITNVNSEPTDAKCTIVGDDYLTKVKTPTALEIPTSAAPLTVSCVKENFFLTENTITAEGNPWVLGNAIIGGGIGLLVDVVSGSSVTLPKNILIKLDPKNFQSSTELTAYFENRKIVEAAAWDKLIRREKDLSCDQKSYTVDCPHEPDPELFKKKNEALKRMDWMAANAVVLSGVDAQGENESIVSQYRLANDGSPILPPASYVSVPRGLNLRINGSPYSVKSSSGFEAVLRSVGGNDYITNFAWFARLGENVLDHSSRTPYPWSFDFDNDAEAALQNLWPLIVGKKVSFVRESESNGQPPFRYSWRKWHTSLEVKGTAFSDYRGNKVAVYVVEETTASPAKDTQGDDSRSLTLIRKHFYAPSIGGVVRRESHWLFDGVKQEPEIVLVTFVGPLF